MEAEGLFRGAQRLTCRPGQAIWLPLVAALTRFGALVFSSGSFVALQVPFPDFIEAMEAPSTSCCSVGEASTPPTSPSTQARISLDQQYVGGGMKLRSTVFQEIAVDAPLLLRAAAWSHRKYDLHPYRYALSAGEGASKLATCLPLLALAPPAIFPPRPPLGSRWRLNSSRRP